MVTPLSSGGVVARAFALFAVLIVSGLLVVTKFLAGSAVLRMEGFIGAGVALFAATTGLLGAGLAGACLAGSGFAAGFTDFAGAAFFTAGLLAAGFVATFETGFANVFLGTGLAAFFAELAADFAFTAGFDDVLRAVCALPRAALLPRAAACATFARLTDFCLLFAIPRPIL